MRKIHYVGENAGEKCTSRRVFWDADKVYGICFDHDRRVKKIQEAKK